MLQEILNAAGAWWTIALGPCCKVLSSAQNLQRNKTAEVTDTLSLSSQNYSCSTFCSALRRVRQITLNTEGTVLWSGLRAASGSASKPEPGIGFGSQSQSPSPHGQLELAHRSGTAAQQQKLQHFFWVF